MRVEEDLVVKIFKSNCRKKKNEKSSQLVTVINYLSVISVFLTVKLKIIKLIIILFVNVFSK